jgi:hypothetical protein
MCRCRRDSGRRSCWRPGWPSRRVPWRYRLRPPRARTPSHRPWPDHRRRIRRDSRRRSCCRQRWPRRSDPGRGRPPRPADCSRSRRSSPDQRHRCRRGSRTRSCCRCWRRTSRRDRPRTLQARRPPRSTPTRPQPTNVEAGASSRSKHLQEDLDLRADASVAAASSPHHGGQGEPSAARRPLNESGSVRRGRDRRSTVRGSRATRSSRGAR